MNRKGSPFHQTRSAGAGLERSCQGPVAGWIACTRPAGRLELFSAWFAGEAYQKHRHDTYAVGVTDSGVQVFDYRGSTHVSMPGQVVVLYPDEVHDGRAGSGEGFGYRIVYVEPSVLSEALRDLRGKPCPLPFVGEAVTTNATLSRAIDDAFRAPLEPLAVDSVVVTLSRQFRIMLGTSPHRYLLMRRLELARERMHRGRPLAEVACDAGFSDQAHFTRAFKSAFGLTPARYRALRRGADCSLDPAARSVLPSRMHRAPSGTP